MSNSVVTIYRKNLASQGAVDSRDDLIITLELGKNNPALLDQYPDFASDFGDIRDANAPPLITEFGRALKSGTQSLLATGAGLAALATDSDTMKRAAVSLERDASENAPTVATLDDIAPGRTGLRKALSMDTARYIAAKAGGAISSLVEMVGGAAVGGAIGTAVEPGVGTIAGAGEGALEGILGRGIIKSAIKRLVSSGVAGDLTEVGVADAIRAGDQKLADLVTQQAKSLVARQTYELANLANIYGTTAGGIYNETGRRDIALGVGAAGTLPFAIPGLSIASRVTKRLFPDLAPEAAQQAAKELVEKKTGTVLARLGRAGKAVGGGTASVVAMEASNIIAKNLADGKDALDISPAQWKQLRESAIAGAVASAPFGAAAAMEPRRVAETRPGGPKTVESRPAGSSVTPEEVTQNITPETPISGPPTGTTTDLVRNVTTLPEEQKQARLAELASNPARTPQEEQQFQVLKATVKVPEAAPAPPAAPVVPVPPAEPVAEVTPAPPPEAIVVPAAPEAAPVPGAPAVAPVAAEAFELPRELSGSKPRYGYKDKQFTLTFANDLDKALYILAQKTPSKQDAKFLDAVLKQTGMTEGQARGAGADVRDAIKAKAKDSPAGELTIEPVFEFKPPAGEAAAPAAEVTAPAVPESKPPEPGYILRGRFETKDEAQAAMKPGKNYRLGQGADGKVELWLKPKGARISVGSPPGAESDILNFIEQEGGIKTRSAVETPGGEYDGQSESFKGVARLLLSKGGLAPDELAQYAHDAGLIPGAKADDLYAAVEQAVKNRAKLSVQFNNEQQVARFEPAFLGNENPKKWLRAGKPVSIDNLNAGDSFTVNGEKFTVKHVDENGNVTIEDGISRTVPPGTHVFPDKGKVRRAKRDTMFFPKETVPALAPATYLGTQDFGRAGKVEMYNLTRDIPGHPEGSTVSKETLEKAGYEVPTALTFKDAGYESAEKFLSDYEKRGIHDAFETADEFMRRIFCSGQ